MKTAVGILIAVALIGAIGRAVYPSDWTARIDPGRETIFAALDRIDPRLDVRPTVIHNIDSRYGAHPVLARLHTVLGGAMVLLVPVQFTARVRNRYRSLHRWSGRTLLVLGVIIAATAFYFGVLYPFAGRAESITIAPFIVFFLFAGTKAYFAIRRGDITSHREWMIRAFAVALGAGTVRLIGGPIDLALAPSGYSQEALFVLAVWIGWAMSLGGAELWIARTRLITSGRDRPGPS